MKRIIVLFLFLSTIFSAVSCTVEQETDVFEELNLYEICELSVMECYYHNVAKYTEKDADNGFLGLGLWKKDMRFWIEYTGIVKVGIDASFVKMIVEGDTVKITMPMPKVLGVEVDPDSLTEDSYIVDKNSAEVGGEDHAAAIKIATEELKKQAMEDETLLTRAQDRAKILIEEYITNVSSAVGKQYKLEWIYLDAEGNPIETE